MMLGNPTFESLALAMTTSFGVLPIKNNESNNNVNSRKKNKGPQPSNNKDSLWSNYCKKPWHTKETCWKLHGRPQFFSNGIGNRSGQ